MFRSSLMSTVSSGSSSGYLIEYIQLYIFQTAFYAICYFVRMCFRNGCMVKYLPSLWFSGKSI